MRDSRDPSAAEARKALELRNGYPQDAAIGGGIVGRPGCRRMGAALPGRVQLVYQHTRLNGQEYTLALAGGLLYQLDWATRTWANIAIPAGLTLSATATVYATTFADRLILSDGVRAPIAWTGAAWEDLTNCPPLFGQPTVHYAKLFGIKANERNAIVWSEEQQPNAGYEAGGFNNAWSLVQTDQEPLYALAATEGALYYFRDRAIGTVLGAVTEDFRGAGVQDSVSRTIGTTSPGSVALVGQAIYFLDADAHPQMLLLGGGVQRGVWEEARETCRQLPRGELIQARAFYYEPANLVLFAVAGYGSAQLDTLLAFDAPSGTFAGVWTGWTGSSWGMVKNAGGVPTLLRGTAAGWALESGNPDGSTWDDELEDGQFVAIEHVVVGTALGYDALVDKVFHRIDASFRLASDLTELSFDVLTPGGSHAPVSAGLEGAFSLWGALTWGAGAWSSDAAEQHIEVGILASGRWVRPRLIHRGRGERFGFLGWTVTGAAVGPSPSLP
jgi:hypothetical protein